MPIVQLASGAMNHRRGGENLIWAVVPGSVFWRPASRKMRPEAVLKTFDPITLKEMDSVQLLDRIDTKFVFGEALLTALLDAMHGEYRVLEVSGERGTGYRTLYYDTSALRHFNDHHSGRPLRSKVRYREYVGSGLSFLEVKRKTGRGRTDKVRLRVDGIPLSMPDEHVAFIHKATGYVEPHTAQLWNSFKRYTFVHRRRSERLTIDTGVAFEREGRKAVLGPACIAELKQQPSDPDSPFSGLMQDLGQRPTGMSKYCVGMWKLVPEMQYGTFIKTFHEMARLQGPAVAITESRPAALLG